MTRANLLFCTLTAMLHSKQAYLENNGGGGCALLQAKNGPKQRAGYKSVVSMAEKTAHDRVGHI